MTAHTPTTMIQSTRRARHRLKWVSRAAATTAGAALVLGSSAAAASATTNTHAAGRSPSSSILRAVDAAIQKQRAAEAVLTKARFGIPTATTPNWSGYVDTNYKSTGKFTIVWAQWNVPQVAPAPSDCNAGTFATGEGLAGFWVGLDGDGTGTVEQTGTATECYQGTAYYWDWYEMYPNPPVVIGAVNPGDEIQATVSNTTGKYSVAINDVTAGAAWSGVESCPTTCLDRSAEVIAEAPGGCVTSPGQTCRGGNFLLPDFQWARFTGISVASKTASGGIGKGAFGPQRLTMVNSGNIKLSVVTSALRNSAFTVSWKASG